MRRGFALPVTLVVMVVIGGLVAAILFLALIGRRSGAAMVELAHLQFAAEAAAYGAVNEFAANGATSLPVSDIPIGMGGVSVTRFGAPVWSVVATESGGQAGGVSRAGLLLVSRPKMLLRQGLATPGTVSLLGLSSVDFSGVDSGEGCGAFVSDSSVAPADFSSTSQESLEQWLGRATKLVLPSAVVAPGPVTVGAVCDEGVVTNWGDPTDPMGVCGSFFPTVGAAGDLVIEGGGGQGVLAVTGNLTARSNFSFRGLVIVGGRLVLESGAQMFGAVQVDDSLLVGSVLDGGRIAYSGCALREALANFGMISVLAQRGWFRPF